jgi:hypothetical protein
MIFEILVRSCFAVFTTLPYCQMTMVIMSVLVSIWYVKVCEFQQIFSVVYDFCSRRVLLIHVSQCKALAAALFGPTNVTDRYEAVPVTTFDRFTKLNNSDIDVLIGLTTHSMERQITEVWEILAFVNLVVNASPICHNILCSQFSRQTYLST